MNYFQLGGKAMAEEFKKGNWVCFREDRIDNFEGLGVKIGTYGVGPFYVMGKETEPEFLGPEPATPDDRIRIGVSPTIVEGVMHFAPIKVPAEWLMPAGSREKPMFLA